MNAFVSSPAVEPVAFARIRRRMMLEGCKWDPQVGDVATLSPDPLVLRRGEWTQLASWSEALAAEGLAAERELCARPDLVARLGLSRRVRRAIADTSRHGATPGLARVARFDFHPTSDGWRISEANSDVPGGFIESGEFARLVAASVPGTKAIGDPAATLADALAREAGSGAIPLVHATAYADDRQVMESLARLLTARGLQPRLVAPDHLDWRDGHAHVAGSRVAAIVRFFPGEWLPNLPRASGWQRFFSGGLTPMSNPATALTWQSKRFPLTWDALRTPLPTWRALLPETRDPRDVAWPRDASWVMKPALGRAGEDVLIPGQPWTRSMHRAARWARWLPGGWAAQRRFDALAVGTSSARPAWPCIGVFVIDGRACGAYGRLGDRPLIDQHAREAAVLVET